MKQAFFLVSALFVLFQLGGKVTAASIEVSSENTEESDRQTRIKNAGIQIDSIVKELVDLLNYSFDSFQIKFDAAHQTVAEIINDVMNLPDDASEKVKMVLQTFQSTFSDGHGRLMALIDQYQAQYAQSLSNFTDGINEAMITIASDINAAEESSESSAAEESSGSSAAEESLGSSAADESSGSSAA